MRIALSILVLCTLALVGCKKSAPATPPTSSTIDERQACGADEDCAVVEVGCCDHCNGGALVGAHKDAAAEIHSEATAACGEVACTLMACVSEPAAICRAGRCGVAFNGQDTFPDLPTR